MNLPPSILSEVCIARVAQAYHTVRTDLLAQRTAAGHWVGELSSSALSTATAISALVLAEQGANIAQALSPQISKNKRDDHCIYQNELSLQIIKSLHWLAKQQNPDGGWGDTDRSYSNLATTMLVRSAFQLTGVPNKYSQLIVQADRYIKQHGGVNGLKKLYGKDKTFAVPILANYALAGLVPWKKVPALPFEIACIPQHFFHLIKMPVVSYALPALVAIGQARHYHAPSYNPLRRWIRNKCVTKSLQLVEQMQPESGGFLEATPLTSFVVMSLSSIGQAEHPVTRRGIEFLLASVRPDGSWPIDSNLATWVTTLSLNSLEKNTASLSPSQTPSSCGPAIKETNQHQQSNPPSEEEKPSTQDLECLDWLLDNQHQTPHPATGAAAGGWGWTDLSGNVPDADDTAGALLTLNHWKNRVSATRQTRLEAAAVAGADWLLDLQNSDGGWPTFCRGWGTLPFDQSTTDLTAHTIRALACWNQHWTTTKSQPSALHQERSKRIRHATAQGFKFLEQQQTADGSWAPLWFGNQHQLDTDKNLVYGTARVLQMYAALGLQKTSVAARGAAWLAGVQHAGGGWGPVGRSLTEPFESDLISTTELCSVEETALALEALLPYSRQSPMIAQAVTLGTEWLCQAVEQGDHHHPTPIGFYFARLWYHEQLYPLAFSLSALAKLTQPQDFSTAI